MNLIEIQGPVEIIQGLLDVEGLSLARHSATQTTPDRWSVSGTATDAAIATIESRGATVTIHMDNSQYAAHIATVYGQIGSDDTGIG